MLEFVPEARRLFGEFKKLLDREFRNETEAALVDQKCKTIIEQLSEMGFKIMAGERTELKSSTLGGRTKIWIEIHIRLLLLSASQTTTTNPIEETFATAKIYDPILSNGDMLEAKFTDQDRQVMRSMGVKIEGDLEYPEDNLRGGVEWRFTPKQNHALLAALNRHWQTLLEAAEEKEIIMPPYETWARIMQNARIMVPAGDDTFIFKFLIEQEIEYLRRKLDDADIDIDFEICGCNKEDHIEILDRWRDENL